MPINREWADDFFKKSMEESDDEKYEQEAEDNNYEDNDSPMTDPYGLNKMGDYITDPASSVMKAIQLFDKPRGAIAGGVDAMLDNSDIIEGIKKGWEDNTSWKEAISDVVPDEFEEEHPNIMTGAGLVADIVADPLWVATPAKIVKGASSLADVTGITKKVEPLVDAFKESEFGQKAIAGAEDALGINRVEEAGINDAFNAGRAEDAVYNEDVVDNIAKFNKENPDNIEDVTKYVEAADRPAGEALEMTDNVKKDILDSIHTGKAPEDINNGVFSKEDALKATTDAGEEVPDYLLQQHQIDAKLEAQQKIDDGIAVLRDQKNAAREAKDWGEVQRLNAAIEAEKASKSSVVIPDYVYRDQILQTIPDEYVRKAVKSVGDEVIAKNKEYAKAMQEAGLLDDTALVHFKDGSHLRRSYEKYENPEDFLKAIKKDGTPEEWQRAYTDYQKIKSGAGTTAAHKINQQDFMKRQQLSSATMEKMGLIKNAQYRAMDTFDRSSKALREDTFLKEVGKRFGKTEEEAAKLSRHLPKSRQYVPVPDSKAYGALAGKWIPKDVADTVTRHLGLEKDPGALVKGWQTFVSHWKVGKLANPASIARNFYSGLPMANVFGKVGMLDLPRAMKNVNIALKNGKNSTLFREFRMSGATDAQQVRNELGNIIGKNKSGLLNWAETKSMKAFSFPDQYWRMVVFDHYRHKGESIQAAGKMARKALLDYSNSPNWVNRLARNGIIPFAKFPFHAGKETAKALYHDPANVTKYFKLQNQNSDKDEKKLLPSYLKPETLLPIGEGTRTVNGVKQKVKNNIDLSYILPFANDVSISNPAIDALMLARTGKNGIGQQLIRDGMTWDEKAKVFAENAIFNTIAPTAVSGYTIDRLKNGYYQNVDSKGRQYDLPSAIGQTVFGIKNVPINDTEMYEQKDSRIKAEINKAKIEMSRIKKDQSMNNAQRESELDKYNNRLEELNVQRHIIKKAYKNIESRGK